MIQSQGGEQFAVKEFKAGKEKRESWGGEKEGQIKLRLEETSVRRHDTW